MRANTHSVKLKLVDYLHDHRHVWAEPQKVGGRYLRAFQQNIFRNFPTKEL